jgi:hypothetical protein
MKNVRKTGKGLIRMLAIETLYPKIVDIARNSLSATLGFHGIKTPTDKTSKTRSLAERTAQRLWKLGFLAGKEFPLAFQPQYD